MNTYRIRIYSSVLVSFFLLLTLLSSGGVALETGYPDRADDHVNDFAGVISPADAEAIGKLFQNIEKQTKKEGVVVTINTITDYPSGDGSLESFATNLFNTWGIGDKETNDGILLLVAVDDKKCRIELGGAYDSRYDGLMQQVIDDTMLPYFKNGEYSRGIYEGSRAAMEKVTEKVSWFSYYKWHIVLVILIIVCIGAGISCFRSGKKGWGWIFFAGAGLLLI